MGSVNLFDAVFRALIPWAVKVVVVIYVTPDRVAGGIWTWKALGLAVAVLLSYFR